MTIGLVAGFINIANAAFCFLISIALICLKLCTNAKKALEWILNWLDSNNLNFIYVQLLTTILWKSVNNKA